MYRVNGETFPFFMAAVRAAEKIGAEVFEVETGIRRWHPAPKVDAKRMRRYNEQKAAYEAQQNANSR